MKFILLTVLIIFISSRCFGQVTDNFNDGDFTQNPTWIGDTSEYKVNNNLQLQLDATEAGICYLTLPSEKHIGTQEWRFYIRVTLAPSDNNNARIYLTSNTLDIRSDTLTGYYLQFGENLSNDAIELFYQDVTESHSICRGIDGFIAASFSLNIKVLLHEEGLWEIFIEDTETGKYTLHASGSDNIRNENPIIGFYNKFTAGSKNKFYLDDIYHGPEIIDTTPPTLLKISGDPSGQAITLLFSEKISTESAHIYENYVINNILYPDSISFIEENFNNVKLHFHNPLADRTPHSIKIQHLEDLNGNCIADTTITFQCNKIRRHDLLITEIMADPSPPVELPNCEYVEIYNRGIPDTLTLEGWKLMTGETTRYIPTCKIAPNGYIILIPNSDNPPNFNVSNTISVNSLSISNDGQRLTLLNADDEVIHCVNFSNEWHTHELKTEGGWSLEMIDTENPCEEENNWESSEDERGGTPGSRNSIQRVDSDLTTPHLLKATFLDTLQLQIFFSETILPPLTANHFHIDRNTIIDSVAIVGPQNKSAIIYIGNKLENRKIYTLTIRLPFSDCAGNNITTEQSLCFAIPETPNKEDIIINEVLFNSFDDTSADYIELYNRSPKCIELQQLFIGYGTEAMAEQWVQISPEGTLLLPQEYISICKNSKLTEEQYINAIHEQLIQNEELPSLGNESGTIYLTNNQGIEIDKFSYNENMHYPLLRSYDGVSLERIHSEAPTQNVNNWKSAAESIGFGTPGGKNSQNGTNLSTDKNFEIIPDIFSPNNDGYEDFSELICHFEQSEYRVTINIFNYNGQLVKNLANNIIAQSTERFLWDGTDTQGQQLPMGIYMIELEYWNIKGTRGKIRKAISIIYP